MKGAMVAVLGQSCAALFACVAMATGHDHWELEPREGSKLGEALDKALSTLPEKAYEKVIEVADKWYPWGQLAFVLGVLLWTRVEESTQLAQGGGDQPREGGVNGSGRTEQSKANGSYPRYHSSLGYDS